MVDLSNDPSRWGQFGDYVGGALNPIFSFFALIALLLTIVLQSEELSASRQELKHSVQALQDSKDVATRQAEHFETQAKKEDVYRMIKYVFDELSTHYKHNSGFSVKNEKGASLGTYIFSETFGVHKLPSFFVLFPAMGDSEGNYYYNALAPLLGIVRELKDFLMRFESLSGDDLVTSYYKKRYAQVVLDLFEKGYIDVETADYFKTALPSK